MVYICTSWQMFCTSLVSDFSLMIPERVETYKRYYYVTVIYAKWLKCVLLDSLIIFLSHVHLSAPYKILIRHHLLINSRSGIAFPTSAFPGQFTAHTWTALFLSQPTGYDWEYHIASTSRFRVKQRKTPKLNHNSPKHFRDQTWL